MYFHSACQEIASLRERALQQDVEPRRSASSWSVKLNCDFDFFGFAFERLTRIGYYYAALAFCSRQRRFCAMLMRCRAAFDIFLRLRLSAAGRPPAPVFRAAIPASIRSTSWVNFSMVCAAILFCLRSVLITDLSVFKFVPPSGPTIRKDDLEDKADARF